MGNRGGWGRGDGEGESKEVNKIVECFARHNEAVNHVNEAVSRLR